MKNIDFLENILSTRKKILEFIAGAILVGFGVEFITNSVFSHFECYHKSILFLIIGLILIFVGLIFFILKIFGVKNYKKDINGFLLINKKEKTAINIDSYDFSQKMSDYIKYAFNEDPGLKKIWTTTEFQVEKRTDKYKEVLKIINEAAEYYLLNSLSIHLLEFFNNEGYDLTQIKEYQRLDIPDVLLKNRFLELFSKPMEQRAAFLPDEEATNNDSIEDDENIIVGSYSNGAMFSRFDLNLPRNSKIKRNSDNSISIDTKRFTLRISSVTDGGNTYIPWEFCKLYLNLSNILDISMLDITFKVQITFHFGAFFRTAGWQYYEWIDSFISRLIKDFEKEYYLNEKIAWNKAYPIIKCISNLKDNPIADNQVDRVDIN